MADASGQMPGIPPNELGGALAAIGDKTPLDFAKLLTAPLLVGSLRDVIPIGGKALADAHMALSPQKFGQVGPPNMAAVMAQLQEAMAVMSHKPDMQVSPEFALLLTVYWLAAMQSVFDEFADLARRSAPGASTTH